MGKQKLLMEILVTGALAGRAIQFPELKDFLLTVRVLVGRWGMTHIILYRKQGKYNI